MKCLTYLLFISYLTTYLWKRTVRNHGKDEFEEFLKLLSMAQRAEDKDFDTSRVMIFNLLCRQIIYLLSAASEGEGTNIA